MKYLGTGLDVGSTKISSVADGAASDDAAAFGQIVGGGGDSVVDPVAGLTWNDASGAVATANHAAIQAALDTNGIARIAPPPKAEWLDGGVGTAPSLFERLFINSPIETKSGDHLIGPGPLLAISQPNNTGLPALITSKNWIANTGSPSAEARDVLFENIGLDGNYRIRSGGSAGTVIQAHATHGHGFAGSWYKAKFINCAVGQTQRHAFYVDTTSENGTTLGECLEIHFDKCEAVRAGLSSFRMADTGNIAGGVTDGFLLNCVSAHSNCAADVLATNGQGTDGAAVFIETAGGWQIEGNHIYSTDLFSGGNWDGYGSPQLTHGMVIHSASGTRLIANQIADFGYHRTDTADQYGIWIRGHAGPRAVELTSNHVWTDEDAGAVHDYYAYRINTPGGGEIRVNASNNTAESRAGTPALKGLKLDASSGGSMRGRLAGFSFPNMASVDMVTTTGTPYTHLGAGLTVSNNDWQSSGLADNGAYDGVSVHAYGPGVGEGNTTIDDAAFAWLLANHPNRIWLLKADTTYNTTGIDLSTVDGGGLIGAPETTKIQGSGANPIIRVGGEGTALKGLHLLPAAGQTGIETAGGVCARANIEDVRIYGGGKAFYSPAGVLFFNNTVKNLRLSNFTDTGLGLLNLGTGSVFTNTYIHSSTSQAPRTNVGGPCNRAIYISGNQSTVEFHTLNLEYMQCANKPVEINGGGNAIFTSVFVEAIQWPSHSEIFSVFGAANTVDIQGFEIVYSFPIDDINTNAAETQAVFGVGDGATLTARSVRARDNGANSLYWTRAINTNADSRIRMVDVEDTGTVAGSPGNHAVGPSDVLGRWPQAAWAQHPAGVWLQFNNPPGAQSLLWDGADWVDKDGYPPIGGINYRYLQKTGDPDPSGVMAAGDVRFAQ